MKHAHAQPGIVPSFPPDASTVMLPSAWHGAPHDQFWITPVGQYAACAKSAGRRNSETAACGSTACTTALLPSPSTPAIVELRLLPTRRRPGVQPGIGAADTSAAGRRAMRRESACMTYIETMRKS
jgi:hypothetical protein